MIMAKAFHDYMPGNTIKFYHTSSAKIVTGAVTSPPWYLHYIKPKAEGQPGEFVKRKMDTLSARIRIHGVDIAIGGITEKIVIS